MFTLRLQQGDCAAHTLLSVVEVYAVISLNIDLLPQLKKG
jgi:hypothetical protein